MVNRKQYRYFLGGLVVVTAIAVTYGLGRFGIEANPREIAIHVSGAPGMTVTGAFEIDSVQEAPQEAELPAHFVCTGRQVAFKCQRVGGPDQPIAVAVDIDGVRRGVGTAMGGVRADVWGVHSEPRFLALPSEPEWQEIKEAGPRPNLIGTRPPEWTVVEWLNSKPLRLTELRGKVVLARWFTGPICSYCVATAPALREFHERYSDQGLAVVGMFHHSDSTLEEVRDIVAAYGFRFPVAVDRGAKTRRLWCLGRFDYGYTSATFLLDQHGVIRYIHPGGQYVMGDADYKELKSEIEQLLDPTKATKDQRNQVPEKSDEERLQGTWKLEKELWMGTENASRLPVELTFLKNKIEHQSDIYGWEATFKLDASGGLKALDMFQDGQIMRWLYRLEDGKLIIAIQGGYEFSGNERPKDFNSAKGNQRQRVWTFAPISIQQEQSPIDAETAQKAQMKKARAQCNANLARLVRAMHRYIDIHGQFPPASTTDGAGKPLLSWRVALLPFMGEDELYKQFRQDEPWDSAHNRKLLAKMPKIYATVGNPPKNDYETFYQVFVGAGTVFEKGKKITPANIGDGTVNTIAIIAAGEAVPWSKPADIPYDAATPLPSLTGGMINDGFFSFATADASPRAVINTINPNALRPFILRNTGDLKDFNSLTNER